MQSQRSYLNHVSSKRTLALLERLLEVEVDNDNKMGVYRKIAQVYAVDRDHATSFRYVEQAVDYSAQGEKKGVAADVLWVEAAQTAIEMEEFGKAHSYLLKALAQNPQNLAARQLLLGLPILGRALL
jgi:tetratricopeptide (TPR) repeat protein